SGKDKNRFATDGACNRTTHHRRRANLLVAEHAEQFAEAGEQLLEQAIDRFKRAVARGNSRTPGRDNHSSAFIHQADVHGSDDRRGIIANDRMTGDAVPPALEKLADRLSAGIVGFGSGIADRQDETGYGNRRVSFVLLNAHHRDYMELECGLMRLTWLMAAALTLLSSAVSAHL